MQKIGYALLTADGAVAEQLKNYTVDDNGRPQMRVLIPGTNKEVHCPTVGAEYDGFKLVERWYDDPGAPSPWHLPTETTAVESRGLVTRVSYPKAPNTCPDEVSSLQMRRALRQSGMRDQVDAFIESSGEETKESWEYATRIPRGHSLVREVAAALKMSAADVDQLFRLAATL